jgi:glyoxylase-like metal-dependent hydrolase (beta-lactamase superfamily II)
VTTELPPGVRCVRADNPGPMTLEGTNTWLLDGESGTVVVDPGPDDPAHAAAVLDAAPAPVTLVLLTHGHRDHSEGATALARAVGAPVRARDPRHCSQGAAPLEPDERIGPLRVLATPGHTSDSVCFVLAQSAVLTGDTVLGRGTTVVAHPDGRLDDYLASLEILAGLGDRTVLPGHGPVLPSAREAAADYLAHRRDRLEQVRAAVEGGCRTAGEVVDAVYGDVPAGVRGAAEASVRAQLLHLGVDESREESGR